ncbi:MAG: MBL fold metallo-hydrolase [Candidatus Omnitrophica bacterium]|nr:MBL fold metallo-hydrolase [Candidatus Omnitrophota bacterium]
MILESICVGAFQVNCYVLASGKESSAIIIDPGDEKRKIEQILNKYKLNPIFIINTHGHIDHIGCDNEFGIPIYIHRDEIPLLKDASLNLSNFLSRSFKVKSHLIRPLNDKEIIELEGIRLEVIHTPGHTPGAMCLLMKSPKNKILFTGDTLFFHSIGRTDFPGADERFLIRSIKDKLFNLADDTLIYPGHGPPSTIGEEKRNNPFLY